MSNIPPTPPLKSSQRLSLPANLTQRPSVRVVTDTDGPLIFSRPSLRRPERTQQMDDDPRRLAQNAVRQAAGGSIDRPILDRGRPRIGPEPSPQRQDSARSPPGTRAPANIDLDEGFSYIDDDTETLDTPEGRDHSATTTQPSSADISLESSLKSHFDHPPTSHARGVSFGGGKPRGLSFHDARPFMRSGRSVRAGSWHEAPVPAPSRAEFVHLPPIRTASRSRSPSPEDMRRRSPSPYNRSARDEEEGLQNVTFDVSSLPDQQEEFRASVPVPRRRSSKPVPGSRRVRPIRRHFVAALGELLGTTSFLFAAFGAVIVASANSPNPTLPNEPRLHVIDFNISRLFYMSFAFGISYMINVWIFFRASEGLFNPAVTLALLITGTNGFVRSLFLFAAQVAGGIAASALALGLFQNTAPLRTTLNEDVSTVRGLFIEAILTSQLVLAILMLAREKHKTTSVAPLGIGLALIFGELVGIFWTGGSLNPIRSFGPNVVSWYWESTHWIYWVGPLVGALVAVVMHKILMALGRELGSPSQRNDVHVATRHQSNGDWEKPKDAKAKTADHLAGASGPLGPIRYADSDLTGIINLWHRTSAADERKIVVAPSARRIRK